MSAIEGDRRLRFPADVAWLAHLRNFALHAVSELGLRVDQEALVVVVGELTANAAIHQPGEAELALRATVDGGVEVSVTDSDPSPPRAFDQVPWDVDGHRGIQLVSALSADWGVVAEASGKRVWARLAPLGAMQHQL